MRHKETERYKENETMKTKERVMQSFKDVLDRPEDFKNCRACDFIADDGHKEKRVYLAETCGLDWPENKGCHVNLSLYYDTHYAMTIGFATHKDAWEYVESKGEIDRRIIHKWPAQNGWKLVLKSECQSL